MGKQYTATPMVPPQPAAAAEDRGENDVATQLAYLNFARHLSQLGQPICGLWPVEREMIFPLVPRHLARALASLGITVGLVESPDRWRDAKSRTSSFTSALGEGVELLTPAWVEKSSLGVAIERVLELVGGRYACILLDLSGLDIVAANEVALVPGVGVVLLVARGRINEFSLAKIRRRLPPERVLGAVLVDVEQTQAGAAS